MIYWLIYLLILITGLVLLAMPFWRFRRAGRPVSRRQGLIENLCLSLFVLFLTFMALEFYFKLFFAQSDGFGYTLAAKNWYEHYWSENSLGYRDVEWTPEKLSGKTKVMVVGDSFTAGTGIANPADRFSDQLGRLLGNDYAVLNVASPGWDTIDEIKAVVNYPYRPDIIILAYYINDIEGTAYERGHQRPQLRRDPLPWLRPLVENSYTLNFLYWRLARLGAQTWADVYWKDWLMKIAADPEIRWQHRQELLTIMGGAASERVPLLVVVFPNLAAVEESRPLTEPVVDLFEEQGLPVLDVTALVAGRNPADTTVNALDAHPNEAINLEIAEQLYQMIQTQPLARP